VNFVQKALADWNQDNLLRRIVRNSGYLFVGNTLSTIVQSILSARLLGILGFGILGVVIEFATNINRLLSFRMGELVVRYMGQYLSEGRSDRAAAVFKASVLLESVSSVLAYLLLALLAPVAALHILKDPTAAALISFYALALLGNFATESSTGFLQVTDRFRSQALINFIQSLLTAGLVIYAFLVQGDIRMVLGAYLAGKVFNGLTLAGYAFWRAGRTLGAGWWRASFSLLPPRREFLRFALSTNLSGTVTMLTRDSESIWLSSLLGPLTAGYFKTARAVINLVTLPITPFINAAYPAINRSVAEKAWARLLDLLKKLTLISAAWTGAVSVALLFGGQWLITTFYGQNFSPAFPAMMILLVGFGFANVFYWNRNLLLSFGEPDYPLKVIAAAGAVKLLLTFLLVPLFGYLMEAALMTAFFLVSIGLIVLRGVRRLRANLRQEPEQGGTATPQPQPPLPAIQPGRDPGLALRRRLNRWDWLAAGSFLVFAALFCLGRLQGNYPLVVLSGDAGNIASYAAALDHPGWFDADAVLNDPGTIGVYATIHIPLIRALVRLAGDYGLASVLLVFPLTFLQLLGFYILGRVLFRDRFWAYLLAWLTAMTVDNIGLGEIWGVWQDSLPRVTFQSLLPFLLALVLVWKDQPRRWIWLMVFAGALVYVHPISAPAWGFALWLGLWLFHPRTWTLGRRLLVMLGLGGVFLAVLIPFALNYLSYRGQDPVQDVSAVMSILQTYAPINLFNVPAAVGDFLSNMTANMLIPLGLAGLALTWFVDRGARRQVKVVLLWVAGLLITSVLIPWGERLLEARLNILPLETELLRCIRYLVPLLLLFWLWGLAGWVRRLERKPLRWAGITLGILLVAFWGATNHPAVGDMLDATACLGRARLVCAEPRPLDELLTSLREQTQPGEGVFFYNQDLAATSQSLSVRYAGLRPLVYSYRDSGILGYGDRAGLPAWLEITGQVAAIRLLSDPGERASRLLLLAAELSAGTLVIDFELSPEALASLPGTVLMQNDTYTLLQLP